MLALSAAFAGGCQGSGRWTRSDYGLSRRPPPAEELGEPISQIASYLLERCILREIIKACPVARDVEKLLRWTFTSLRRQVVEGVLRVGGHALSPL